MSLAHGCTLNPKHVQDTLLHEAITGGGFLGPFAHLGLLGWADQSPVIGFWFLVIGY